MKRITMNLLFLLSVVLFTGFVRVAPTFADEVIASDQQEIQFELYEKDEVSPIDKGESGTTKPQTGSLLYGTSAFLGTLLIGFVGLMYRSRRQKR
ncbi:LPXTG cell wall anchor domain-containing protein [Enterococcus mundtii]|uniref:LPXTG cell wall anchor domain-containing protein n=1 Tax=Enterococcus mundtii TaxID=53346 RepID=UPI00403CD04E